MANLEIHTTSDLFARMTRIQNGHEPVTKDADGDTVLLLLRLNIVADEINQAIQKILKGEQ